jgi:protein O-GlcNAc transferase
MNSPHSQGFERALASFRQGRLDEVSRLCVGILQQDARHFAALHLLGLVALQSGDAARALQFMRESIAINPQQPDVHLNIGNALVRLGNLEAALTSCDAALALKPDFIQAWSNRGNVLRDLRRHEQALDSYARALTLQPSAAIHINRGNALFKLGRIDDALASYDEALLLAPQDVDAQFNRGNAQLKLGRWADALASYEAVVALNPKFAKGHHYRGIALRRLQRPEEALASFGHALAIDANYRDARCGLANALRDLGRFTESLSAYDAVLQFDPNSLEALSNRARVLLSLNRPQEAAQCLERLFQVDPEVAPGYNFALGNLLHARLLCCEWRDYQATSQAIMQSVLAGERSTLPPLFIAMSDSPAAQLQCARDFVEDNWAAGDRASVSGARARHEKLRIAYVSADFREHPVAQLMAGIFEAHDRDRFETVAISLRPQDGSATAKRIRDAFSRFVDVTANTDAEAASLMRELQVDIAVDLTGYTDGFRPGIFARRAAPIQVNYLGYPGTLAASYMDYIIADRVVIPEADQAFYTEQVVYLPDCYQPNDAGRAIAEHPPTREYCGLPEAGFVFCCFNNQYKIQPPLFDVWMRLLQSIDGSVLWLSKRSDTVTHNLRREALARGVSPERLIFAPRMPALNDHLARYGLADLFLDTLPFNAHTTASDALWAGLPVLTCRGNAFAGRVAASLLTTVGLPELITATLQEYAARAFALAQRPAELAQLHARLEVNRGTSALFDTRRLCRHLEAAYTLMWERAQRGAAPEGFSVPRTS